MGDPAAGAREPRPSAAPKPPQAGLLRTALAMSLNFIVSVSIVSVNKFVYLGGFRYNMAMTALHFATTAIGLEVCARCGVFERKFVPLQKVLPISIAFCGFVFFNNLSL